MSSAGSCGPAACDRRHLSDEKRGAAIFAGKRPDMSASDIKKCDNLACLCEVPVAETVCAPYCDSPDGRDPANVRCRCGHAVCESQIEEQLHGGIGRESP